MTAAATFTTRWVVQSNILPPIIAGLDAKAAAFVAKTAHDLEAGMKAIVAIDTGTLRNSIQAIKMGALWWRVVIGAEYGIFVEYGTYKMAAQPFVAPTVARVRPEFLAAMRTLVTFP